jgi:hypothetical protein
VLARTIVKCRLPLAVAVPPLPFLFLLKPPALLGDAVSFVAVVVFLMILWPGRLGHADSPSAKARRAESI